MPLLLVVRVPSMYCMIFEHSTTSKSNQLEGLFLWGKKIGVPWTKPTVQVYSVWWISSHTRSVSKHISAARVIDPELQWLGVWLTTVKALYMDNIMRQLICTMYVDEAMKLDYSLKEEVEILWWKCQLTMLRNPDKHSSHVTHHITLLKIWVLNLFQF